MVMAEVQQGGRPMAHQLPLHNHRGGLVQPSLVMNHHHIDVNCHQTGLEIHPSNISKCKRNKTLREKLPRAELVAGFRKNQRQKRQKPRTQNIELLDTK